MNVFISLLPAVAVLALCYGIGRQLAHPRGWIGRRLMVPTLNRGNKSMLDAAVEALAPRPGERIVDVGFGGGYALDRIREAVAPARAVGVEIAEAMIASGRERCGNAVELHHADVAALPFDAASFDAVLSVNTIYFWPNPQAALGEIHRVLKPGGRLVLGVRAKAAMILSPVTWFSFRLYSIAKLQEMMRAGGFSIDQVVERTPGELVLVARSR
jgi:ubiquinone/menaquinone biosynthesis C-methylase UbiE